MLDTQQPWQQVLDETQQVRPSDSEEMPLSVAIVSYGGIGVLLLAWFGFCGWLALEMREQLLDPNADSHGYGRLLDFLRDQFGVWPATAIFFAFMQIPVLAIYVDVRRKSQTGAGSEHLPPAEPWIPRFSDATAKKLGIVLAILFQCAAAAILFGLLPTGICAIVLAATPVLAIALRAHQGPQADE